MAFDLDEDELKATRELNGVGEMDEEVTEEELRQLEGFFNKGWCCDLDAIYNTAMKLLRLYQQEKEKVQEYEKQLDLDYVDKNYVKRELYEQEKEKNKKLTDKMKKLLDEQYELYNSKDQAKTDFSVMYLLEELLNE